MKVLITGATGFIGHHLLPVLFEKGCEISVLTRNPEGAAEALGWPVKAFHWDPSKNQLDLAALEGVSAIVHLAGESIASQRWTDEVKKRIYSSRVDSTRLLVKALSEGSGFPQVHTFVCGSAIGFYGETGEDKVEVGRPAGNDFLSAVCRDWEDALFDSELPNLRKVTLRTGVVLGRDGGALQELEPIVAMGGAGPLGDGRQWMSWIHIKDLCRMIEFALSNREVHGPLNGVAPFPERNKDFMQTFADQVGRPAVLPTPKAAIRLVKGEMADFLLASQKVVPSKSQKLGFEFKFQRLSQAFQDLYPNGIVEQQRQFYQWVDQPIEQVFRFFSDPKNLETLTPPEMGFQMVGLSTEQVDAGTRIDYRLSMKGLPLKWQAEILKWDPPREFVDIQNRGPYQFWQHSHRFSSLKGGTLIEDHIRYKVPMSSLGQFVGGGLVDASIDQMFQYRRKVLAHLFRSK